MSDVTETAIVALQIIHLHEPILPGSFAEKMWPDRQAWRRVYNCGPNGATHGTGMRLAGGSYLARLRKERLVTIDWTTDWDGRIRRLGYRLTAEGREALANAYLKGLGAVWTATQRSPGDVACRQMMGWYRYCYHNQLYQNAGAEHGLYCNPVVYADERDGKCVAHGGKQLVVFEDGYVGLVVRRALRLRAKCKVHGMEVGEQDVKW